MFGVVENKDFSAAGRAGGLQGTEWAAGRGGATHASIDRDWVLQTSELSGPGAASGAIPHLTVFVASMFGFCGM